MHNMRFGATAAEINAPTLVPVLHHCVPLDILSCLKSQWIAPGDIALVGPADIVIDDRPKHGFFLGYAGDGGNEKICIEWIAAVNYTGDRILLISRKRK